MQTQEKYHSETKIVPFGDGTIRVTHHTPILSQKEYEQRKREVEQRLFDVFSKYTHFEN